MGISPETAAEEDSDARTDEANAAAGTPEPASSPEAVSPQAASPEDRQFTEPDFAYYAKADEPNTLDPEHPINARLRDQGVGFVPNVLETDQEAKTAKLGAGALGAMIRVAFGWHVIDDGRQTLVLDPAGKIQIHLNVMRKDGRSIGQMLDEIQAEATQSYSNPEFLRATGRGHLGSRDPEHRGE
ncbi:MAG: hypothetical protein ABIZ80_14470 [Bryobacteraceae bacterium]